MHHWKGRVKVFFYIAKNRATANKEGKMRHKNRKDRKRKTTPESKKQVHEVKRT
jgi:hypothetical protein